MAPRRIITGFLWRFALVYALLIAPWPGFDKIYSRGFRAAGQLVFARAGDRRLLRFEAVPPELHHRLDTRVMLANRDQLDRNSAGPVRYLELDPRGVGWVPTALIVALVLATPVPWGRRGRALVLGLLAVQGFILFSVATSIWDASSELALVSFSPAMKWVTEGLEETLINQLGASFVVPVFIWLLVTIRQPDLGRWIGQADSPMP